MGILSKIFWVLLVIVIFNLATNNFVFDQMGQMSSALSGDAVCLIGTIMAYPLYAGFPIVPTPDDLALTFLIATPLLILFNLRKQVTLKIGVLTLVITWLLIKWISFFVVIGYGCLETLETVSTWSEPISVVMLVIAPILIFVLLIKLIEHLKK